MEEAISRRTADLARDRKALRRNILSYLKKGVGAIGSRVGLYDMQEGIDKVIEQNTMREHLTRHRQPAFHSVPSPLAEVAALPKRPSCKELYRYLR
jgi:hypothetical protein